MLIEGLRKLTLLDYPGKVAATVFTYGCNFRCPFCHNASLVVRPFEETISMDEVLDFFEKRRGILDGICITGGEPLLHADIPEFIEKIKSYGYLVKLDTNGSRPELLAEIINRGLVDYVAMDIKSSREGYAKAVGIEKFDLSPIEKSIAILKEGKTEFEFRTTAVKGIHEKGDFENIGRWLGDVEHYFIQQFVDSGDLIGSGLGAFGADEMKEFLGEILPYIKKAELRGI